MSAGVLFTPEMIVDDAEIRASTVDRTILFGEHWSEMISGFHFGTISGEYTPEIVHDKTIVLTATKGRHRSTQYGHGRSDIGRLVE